MSIGVGQLAEDLKNLQQQFSHYKSEVEAAVSKLNERIKNLEEKK